jgi:LysM repeat protein
LAVGLGASAASGTYVVRRGDTLSEIAQRLGVSAADLARANRVANPNRLLIGQTLLIPGAAGPAAAVTTNFHVVAEGESLDVIARHFHVSVADLARMNGIRNPNLVIAGTRLKLSDAPAVAAPAAPATFITTTVGGYTVKHGGTYADVARIAGVATADVLKLNGQSRNGRVRRGQVVLVPMRWRCPVAGPNRFRDDFGAPRPGHRHHEGVDLLAARNTPVVAPVSGFVVRKLGSLAGLQDSLYGDDGNLYIGVHFTSFGAQGRVLAGTVIGFVGNTGDAAGGPTHLHFEIHPRGGGAVDPYPTLVAACRG